MRDNKNKNKYFLFSGCAIIALFFFVVINVQGNTVICSEINFETFNHYTLFFKYQGGRTVVGCESENIDQSTKINANFLYHLTDLGKELALFGEDDLVLIDKLTGTITESIGAIELGSIQKVTVIDDAVAIITNEGMSTKNDQNYGSRMIWNESYIQSNGGLILTAIQREGYIYTIERNFSTNYRHLYQYDHAGNFLGELDVDFTLSLSETNMVLDTQNNIISSYHNIITVVTSNDEVIQFPILESESFFGQTTLFTHDDRVIGINYGGAIFELDIQKKQAILLDTLNFGPDSTRNESEGAYNCYINQIQTTPYLVCNILSESTEKTTLLNSSLTNLVTLDTQYTDFFAITDTNKSYPIQLIIFDE